jgi:hypothetical protein
VINSADDKKGADSAVGLVGSFLRGSVGGKWPWG